MKSRLCFFISTIILLTGISCSKQLNSVSLEKAEKESTRLESTTTCGYYNPNVYLTPQANYAEYITNIIASPLSIDREDSGLFVDYNGISIATGCQPVSTSYGGRKWNNFYNNQGQLIRQDIYKLNKKVNSLNYTYSTKYPNYVRSAEKLCYLTSTQDKIYSKFNYDSNGLLTEILTSSNDCEVDEKKLIFKYNSTTVPKMPSKIITTYKYGLITYTVNNNILTSFTMDDIKFTLYYKNNLLNHIINYNEINNEKLPFPFIYNTANQLTNLGIGPLLGPGPWNNSLKIRYNQQGKPIFLKRAFTNQQDVTLVHYDQDAFNIHPKASHEETIYSDSFNNLSNHFNFNQYQTLENNTVKNSGTNSGYEANFYEHDFLATLDYNPDAIPYPVAKSDTVSLNFKVNSENTIAHYAIESPGTWNDSSYMRWALVASGNRLFVQCRDNGQNGSVHNYTLVPSIKIHNWYTVALSVNQMGKVLMKVYDNSTGKLVAQKSYTMSGEILKWRFHHWIYRGDSWIDNYRVDRER